MVIILSNLNERSLKYFADSDYRDNVVNRLDIGKTKFFEWMTANALYEEARELIYSDFPSKMGWHKSE